MARLIRDAYDVKCGLCDKAAEYICEWDHTRFGKVVSGTKLYCRDHAGSFALAHSIYMADLPDVLLSQVETASRDDWKYTDNNADLNTDHHRQPHQCPSVSASVPVSDWEES